LRLTARGCSPRMAVGQRLPRSSRPHPLAPTLRDCPHTSPIKPVPLRSRPTRGSPTVQETSNSIAGPRSGPDAMRPLKPANSP
jgi:hypothetical protein